MEEAFDVYWAELVATGNLPTDVTELCKFKLIAAKFFTQSQQDEKARSEALDLEMGKLALEVQRLEIKEQELKEAIAIDAKIMQNFEDGWYECVEEFQREEVATQVSSGGLDTAQIYFNNLVKGLLKLKDPQAMREQLWIAREIQRVFNIRNGKPEDYPNPVINRVQIAMETMVAEEPKEEPKEESEPAVPHIPYAILNVFHNYYDEEMKHFLEEVDDEWSKEIFEREFENHMLYSLLVMRFGEEYARNEMKDMWDHHCKEGEYNSD